MIVVTSNILALPFLVILWALELLLGIITVRLILGKLAKLKHSTFCQALAQITDPVHQAISRRLAAWRKQPVPDWVSWAALILTAIVMQQLLIRLVVSIAQPIQ